MEHREGIGGQDKDAAQGPRKTPDGAGAFSRPQAAPQAVPQPAFRSVYRGPRPSDIEKSRR